ncbi:MAG: hypothetical protein Q8P91_02415 [bacterium]|nr:hypothetical protein [bacterium]
MQQIQVNTIIRDRGQMTWPDEIRKIKEWLSPQSVVTISSSINADEVVIKPYMKSQKNDWDKVWKMIQKARAIKGHGQVGSLSEFIAKDRETHF